MKKDEVILLASRRGMNGYEQYKGRRIYYKVKIPIFTEGKEIPTGNRDKIVENIKEVKKIVDEVWNDEEYRLKASNWLRKY